MCQETFAMEIDPMVSQRLPFLRSFPRCLPVVLLVLLASAEPARAGRNRWTPIGPYGGPVDSLVIDPSDSRILYAVTPQGLFKSSNGAPSWRLVKGFPSGSAVTALAIDPRRPSTLYARAGGDIFRSVDAGASWSRISEQAGCSGLLVDPADSSVLYGWGGGLSAGLCRSEDGGRTWRLVGTPRDGILTTVAIAPGSPSVLYAAFSQSRNAIYRSTDRGETWQAKSNGLKLVSGFFCWVAVDPSSPRTVFAAIDGQDGSIYKSVDAGETWVSSGPRGFPVATGPSGAVYTRGARSLDGGVTWTPTGMPFHVVIQRLRLVVDPADPTRVYGAGYEYGISFSPDAGVSWYLANQGIPGVGVLSMELDPADPSTVYASVPNLGLLRSRQGGISWEWLPSPGLPTIRHLVIHPSSWFFAAISSGSSFHLGRSKDRGLSWEIIEMPPGRSFERLLAVDPSSPGRIYVDTHVDPGGGCEVLASHNGGKSWRCLGIEKVYGLDVDPIRPATLYVVRGRKQELWKSEDRGRTWRRFQEGLPPRTIPYGVVIDPMDSDNLYLTTDAGLFKSIDGGPWQQAGAGLPDRVGYSFVFAPGSSSTIYALMRKAVYRTTDGGWTWSLVKGGLPWNGSELAIDWRSPMSFYVSTSSHGIYKLTLTD